MFCTKGRRYLQSQPSSDHTIREISLKAIIIGTSLIMVVRLWGVSGRDFFTPPIIIFR